MDYFRNIKQILAYTRRAIEDYNMIDDGDKIAVGFSGGKDSIALLVALKQLQRFFPKRFEIVPIYIGMGFDGEELSHLNELCDSLGCTLYHHPTDIYKIVFEVRKESHPCSLCSNMRRGALVIAALEQGCSKIALAHHFDDVVETFYMNLFNEGRLGCFSPVSYLDRKKVYVIRPFIYVPEREIVNFINRTRLKPVKKLCPIDGKTSREHIKKLLNDMSKEDKGLKLRLFGAMAKAGIGGYKVFPAGKHYNKDKSEEKT